MKENLPILGLIALLIGIFVVLPALIITRTPSDLPPEQLPQKETRIDGYTIRSFYHHGHLWVVFQSMIVHHPDCVCHTKLP